MSNMTQSNARALTDVSVSEHGDDIELNSYSEEQGSGRHQQQLPPTDGGKQARMTLIACCISQLPVWGFPISYGIFQEYYTNPSRKAQFSGNISTTGIIGTTMNGIIYVSMPILFGLLGNRLAHLRIHALVLGGILSITSLLGSAFATSVTQLIITQAVIQGFGASLLYCACNVYVDEWYIKRKGFAYGVTLACKASVGVGAPIVFSTLLDHLGYRSTLLIWTGLLFLSILPAPFLLKRRIPIRSDTNNSSSSGSRNQRTILTWHNNRRPTNWTFLKHRTFPIFMLATVVQATSYSIPNTYLSEFAASVLHFSPANAALILVALNVPNVPACLFFGSLSDGEPSRFFCNRRLSINAASALSSLGMCFPVFLLWGFVPSQSYSVGGVVVLTIFSVIWGFFAGGYSSTFAGVVKEVSREAGEHDEFVNTALLYGLLNGGRGVGYIIGGLASVPLFKAGGVAQSMLAYGSQFGALIVFSGCGAAVCGLGVLYKRKGE